MGALFGLRSERKGRITRRDLKEERAPNPPGKVGKGRSLRHSLKRAYFFGGAQGRRTLQGGVVATESLMGREGKGKAFEEGTSLPIKKRINPWVGGVNFERQRNSFSTPLTRVRRCKLF